MLNSIIDGSSSTASLGSVLICSLVSIVFGIVISLTHKYTSKYSKNFLITICVLPLLVNAIIFVVNGNLGTSIAIVGAFSLVRFRSIPGTSTEILVVFFAMVVGLICGVGYIGFAFIVTVIGCLALIILNKVKIFDVDNQEKKLKIVVPENLDYTNIFEKEFNEYTDSIRLEKIKTTNMGQLFELRYYVKIKKDVNEKDFIDAIRVKNGNLKVMLSEAVSENDL